MNIIIVGGGKVGGLLAEQLLDEGHDITVIDKNERVVEQLGNTLDIIGYVGNGATYSVLQSVDIANCDLLIAVTASDEVNMLCCLAAHKLGAKHTVARVRNPEYSEQLYALKEDLGLSMAINPERAAAGEIARILRFPSATKVELFARGRVELVSCRVPEGDCMLGNMRLADLPQRIGAKVLICAVERDDEVAIPSGDFVIQSGDVLYITGDHSEMARMFKRLRLLVNRARSVLIAGGGRITYYLSETLLREGVEVKIIERDFDCAAELGARLPKAVVLHGDASDHELLMEEGIEKHDAFVALTGLDEGNILSALYAHHLHVGKVITKVNSSNLVALIKNSGLESIISPKLITANSILRYVRALDAGQSGGDVQSLYKIVGGRVEVLEFYARVGGEYLDVPLRELHLKKNTLIACIVRKGKTIIPGGADCIRVRDSVLVVSADQRLNELADIIEE